eukprot:482669-Hanusia_phi.AAC.2
MNDIDIAHRGHDSHALVIHGAGHPSSMERSDATVTADPKINPPGGLFRQYVIVSISCPTPSARIYYTLDGTIPGTHSALYCEPILLEAPGATLLMACAIKAGRFTSQVSKAFFSKAQERPHSVIENRKDRIQMIPRPATSMGNLRNDYESELQSKELISTDLHYYEQPRHDVDESQSILHRKISSSNDRKELRNALSSYQAISHGFLTRHRSMMNARINQGKDIDMKKQTTVGYEENHSTRAETPGDDKMLSFDGLNGWKPNQPRIAFAENEFDIAVVTDVGTSARRSLSERIFHLHDEIFENDENSDQDSDVESKWVAGRRTKAAQDFMIYGETDILGKQRKEEKGAGISSENVSSEDAEQGNFESSQVIGNKEEKDNNNKESAKLNESGDEPVLEDQEKEKVVNKTEFVTRSSLQNVRESRDQPQELIIGVVAIPNDLDKNEFDSISETTVSNVETQFNVRHSVEDNNEQQEDGLRATMNTYLQPKLASNAANRETKSGNKMIKCETKLITEEKSE